MSVSRELRIAGGSETIQNKDTGSYFVEAQYIEFDGVKVGVETSIFNLVYCDSFRSGCQFKASLALLFNDHLVDIRVLDTCLVVLGLGGIMVS